MLMLFDWCNDEGVLKVFTIIIKAINIIRWAVPILLIVFCVIDIAKVITNPDQDKDIKKSVANRLIAAVIVFLVPTLVNLVMNIVAVGAGDDTTSFAYNASECWKTVTSEDYQFSSYTSYEKKIIPKTDKQINEETKEMSSDDVCNAYPDYCLDDSELSEEDKKKIATYTDAGDFLYNIQYDGSLDYWKYFTVTINYKGSNNTRNLLLGKYIVFCTTTETQLNAMCGSASYKENDFSKYDDVVHPTTKIHYQQVKFDFRSDYYSYDVLEEYLEPNKKGVKEAIIRFAYFDRYNYPNNGVCIAPQPAVQTSELEKFQKQLNRKCFRLSTMFDFDSN